MLKKKNRKSSDLEEPRYQEREDKSTQTENTNNRDQQMDMSDETETESTEAETQTEEYWYDEEWQVQKWRNKNIEKDFYLWSCRVGDTWYIDMKLLDSYYRVLTKMANLSMFEQRGRVPTEKYLMLEHGRVLGLVGQDLYKDKLQDIEYRHELYLKTILTEVVNAIKDGVSWRRIPCCDDDKVNWRTTEQSRQEVRKTLFKLEENMTSL